MTPPEPGWSALKRVVEEALDLAPEARDGHLAARCPEETHHAEAIRLLRACELAAGSPVLGQPAAEFLAPVLAGVDEREAGVPEALRTALSGRYSIERELGRGGMARVYLARDERHGRPVALKVPHPELVPYGDPSRGAARFQREIEIAARLSHPHILPLYDSGAAGGLLYYITPYVDGETLRHRLSRTGRLPLAETLHLLRDVARALAYAHRQGLVHRDIKPANILLNREGDALVADFGVARGLAAAQDPTGGLEDRHHDGAVAAGPHDHPSPEGEFTETTLAFGTPPYMAPEQVSGGPGIDHRADLYALGAVAYELLTGTAPFAGRPRHEQLAAHVSETPEPVAVRRPDVPEGLARLVDRLLAKRPEDRPRDAAEVVHLLDAALAGLGPAVRGAEEDVAGALGVWSRSLKALPALVVLGLISADVPMRTSEGAAGETSIAVLHFVTRSGTLEEDAFSKGLTDELARVLSRVQGVRVVGRTSLAALARRNLDGPAIGETLGVETVLEGSVRRDPEQVRVAASLVRARDGRILWSETYEVPAREIFALQEQVVRDVVAAVSPRGIGESPSTTGAERGTEDREAYDLYQKGRYLASTRQRDGLYRALGYLEEAVARDSTYARAWAGIADAWTFLGLFGHVPPRDAYPRARVAAERAVELDSRLVEAHATLAHLMFVYEWNWQAAESALERAIALDPRYPPLRIYFASFLHSVGRPEEALEQMAVAKELDPLAPTGIFSGRIYVDTRRPDAAIQVLEEQIELEPRLDLAHQFLAHAYLQKGMPDEAIASMKRAAELSGPRDLAQLAYVYAKTDHPGEARQVLARLREDGRPLDPLGFHLAMAYAALGDTDEAFRWLEAAYTEHGGYMNLLAVATGFESLRSDPRFDELLRRMGLR